MRMQRNTGFVGAILALVLLAIPAIATLFDIFTGPDSPRAEGIARTPVLESGIGRFAADTRFYIKQRYAVKDQFIALNGMVKTEIFSSMPYTSVISGAGGFLFLGDDEAIHYHQRISPFSKEELAAWRHHFIAVTKRLKQKGIRYHVLVAPNKHDVYAEKLPLWVNHRVHEQSRLQQLFSVLSGSSVEITYPLEAILTAIENFPDATPFFRTDTHWNEFGAGIAVAELLRDLQVPFEGNIRPVNYSPDKAGDLARMIGLQEWILDDGWTLPNELLTATCVMDNGTPFLGRQTDPLRFKSVRCSGGKANGLKALIFMDSFGVGMVPSLGSAFEESIFVWGYKLDEALVDQVQPDFVIQQLVERKLQTLSAGNLFGEL